MGIIYEFYSRHCTTKFNILCTDPLYIASMNALKCYIELLPDSRDSFETLSLSISLSLSLF